MRVSVKPATGWKPVEKGFMVQEYMRRRQKVIAERKQKAWVKSTSNVNGVFVSKRTDTLFELKCSEAGGELIIVLML